VSNCVARERLFDMGLKSKLVSTTENSGSTLRVANARIDAEIGMSKKRTARKQSHKNAELRAPKIRKFVKSRTSVTH
jgi:hypothetical protein